MKLKLTAVFGGLLLLMSGCAVNYTTPAGGVDIGALSDDDIATLMSLEPASEFPAGIAVVRIQASGYSSRTNDSYGGGKFSVVTVRDIEDEEDIKNLIKLPMVAGIAPLNRVLIQSNLQSIKDLRLSAARLKADMLLVYSVDTSFHVESTSLGPLSVITLGTLPNHKAYVSATTSGALIDVRTGYVYGASEATEREQQRSNVWSTQEAIDAARIQAESASFKGFIQDFEVMWKSIVEQYIDG
ncbi:hypothetical protein LRP49_10735 [Enterovibrio sp. ZSDZ35]|uniref:Lipoprotein n=1 Tax=Enterovibrio qingdaonensis TaxID=2899818 RepID=A0ABT5QL10_9GAMM|nr:hypothetical protein [Enterovibrio sp. ZSDZ35]MDD1781670.1 hypothetical protein [Enterovibrio sp. ZSDZ35]